LVVGGNDFYAVSTLLKAIGKNYKEHYEPNFAGERYAENAVEAAKANV
jgi:hypothetical protein